MKGADSKITCPKCKGKRPAIRRCNTCGQTGNITKAYSRGLKTMTSDKEWELYSVALRLAE